MQQNSTQNIEPQGNKDKFFKGQQKHEELLFATRKHWIILVPYTFGFLITVTMTVLLLFFVFNIKTAPFMNELWHYQLLAMLGVIFATYAFHKYFNRFLNYYLDVILITNYRIICIEKSLFLKDEKNAIDLHEIQDIRKSQLGIVKNIFNYGEVIISQSGSDTLKTLKYMPFPDHFFRKVNLAKREYILNRRQEKQFPQNDLQNGSLSCTNSDGTITKIALS